MYRFLIFAAVSLLLGVGGSGCREKARPSLPEGLAEKVEATKPAEDEPKEAPDAAMERQHQIDALEKRLAQAQEQSEQGEEIDGAALRQAVAELLDRMPDQPAQDGLAQARSYLKRGQTDEARQSLDEVRAYLPVWEAYWPPAAQAQPLLEAAQDDVEADPERAMVELEQAEALLRAVDLEVPCRRLRAAVERLAPEGPEETTRKGSTAPRPLEEAAERLETLRVTLAMMEALRGVNQARQRLVELAKAEAQAELDRAQTALTNAAQASPELADMVKELEDDFDGIREDLETSAAGAEDRLTALWKKLNGLLRGIGQKHGPQEKTAAAPAASERR
jgi:hypothetical protein